MDSIKMHVEGPWLKLKLSVQLQFELVGKQLWCLIFKKI